MSVLDIRLDDLACFVQVVDSGGFSAAARARGASTKQISRQVARLEADLGARLLTRTTRAVGTTAQGRQFYARATRILEQVDDAETVFAPTRALSGELRVCVPTLANAAGLPAALRALRTLHPALSVQLTLTDQPRDLVAEGFDLQVTTARPTQTTLVVRRLLTMALPIAASAAYLATRAPPSTPADLSGHECLLFVSAQPRTSWTLVHEATGAAETVPVAGSLRSDSSELLYAALHEGLGVGVCGRGYLRGAGVARGLSRVLDGWHFEPMPLYAVFPRSNRRSPLVDAFLEQLVATLGGWL